MVSNFWQKLKKPIVGLAPMDGVTDSAFRFITDKYGLPDVIFTEFFPVEAIVRANKKFTDNLIIKQKHQQLCNFLGVIRRVFTRRRSLLKNWVMKVLILIWVVRIAT